MKETEFKLLFKKSVVKQGGVAYSLNSSFYTGLSDLYISMPGQTPCLVEAKFFNDISDIKKFKRTIPYTVNQKEVLDSTNKVCLNSGLGLVGIKDGRTTWAYLLPGNLRILTSDQYVVGISQSVKGSYFDVASMFSDMLKRQAEYAEKSVLLDEIFGS